MLKLEVDLSKIRNEVAQIHSELHTTYNMTDTQRRDTVARMIEKLRSLKTELENGQVTVTSK